MCCKEKRKNYCLEKVQAICTQYKGSVSNSSKISSEDCLTIEETTQDIYDIIDVIMKVIDLSGLDYGCISLDFEDEDNPTIKEILEKLIEEVCLLKQNSNNNPSINPCEIDLSSCGINPTCLDNALCTGSFSTLPDILNSIITKLCSIDTKLQSISVCDISLEGCNLDFECLVNDYVTTDIDLSQTIQILVTEICTLRSRVEELENK